MTGIQMRPGGLGNPYPNPGFLWTPRRAPAPGKALQSPRGIVAIPQSPELWNRQPISARSPSPPPSVRRPLPSSRVCVSPQRARPFPSFQPGSPASPQRAQTCYPSMQRQPVRCQPPSVSSRPTTPMSSSSLISGRRPPRTGSEMEAASESSTPKSSVTNPRLIPVHVTHVAGRPPPRTGGDLEATASPLKSRSASTVTLPPDAAPKPVIPIPQRMRPCLHPCHRALGTIVSVAGARPKLEPGELEFLRKHSKPVSGDQLPEDATDYERLLKFYEQAGIGVHEGHREALALSWNEMMASVRELLLQDADLYVVSYMGDCDNKWGSWKCTDGNMPLDGLLKIWQTFKTQRRMGNAQLFIYMDSACAGHWVREARRRGLKDVAIQVSCSESEVAKDGAFTERWISLQQSREMNTFDLLASKLYDQRDGYWSAHPGQGLGSSSCPAGPLQRVGMSPMYYNPFGEGCEIKLPRQCKHTYLHLM